MDNSLADQLSRFVPAGTEHLCARWLIEGKIQLKVAAPRKTKLGDFRPAHRHQPHRISVNNNLEPLQFLITFTHEIAHAQNWDKYGRTVSPHGTEWKNIYGQLLKEILALNVLGAGETKALEKHSVNPKASSATDVHLQSMNRKGHEMMLNDLKSGDIFSVERRTFQAIRKLRKYWLCKEPSSGRHYRVLGTVAVALKQKIAAI